MVDGGLDVSREQAVQNSFGGGLELRRCLDGVLFRLDLGCSKSLCRDRQNELFPQVLVGSVARMVVEDDDLVHVAVEELRTSVRGDLAGLTQGRIGGHVAVHQDRLDLTIVEVADALLTADDDLSLDALDLVGIDVLLGFTQNAAVKATCQAAVGNDDDGKASLLCIMLFKQRMIDAARVLCQAGKDLVHGLGIRRGHLDPCSGMANLSSGNHLHSARNLLGALHRDDALLNIAETGHGLSPTPQQRN